VRVGIYKGTVLKDSKKQASEQLDDLALILGGRSVHIGGGWGGVQASQKLENPAPKKLLLHSQLIGVGCYSLFVFFFFFLLYVFIEFMGCLVRESLP